ncbi:serpin-ZX [Arabidopsis lyrata subsp. lyrata]|uniref:serpin-ZX n=1 Tax=Arabidopsis lyrata subsp. lyrata TaxID=81972 RepID=UPI000A29BBDD|nr:serpin-ZX [Arabidopsis lyrata subsp. lyrata]|eukprot:XP_020884644.1 serpin-ZX [Arabidopsis lyrata subsp. lyrata]
MNFKESIENQNDGVFALAKHVIATAGKDSNVVFSPASINVSLSFIAANSFDTIKDQILDFLHASSTDELNGTGKKGNFKESIENQNDGVFALAKHVIATAGEDSNVVFSPASINVSLSFIAANSFDTIKDQILDLLHASSTDELNGVASQILSVILVDGSEKGGLVISAANGVWLEKSLSVEPSFKELLKNFYSVAFNSVDFRTKASQVSEEVNSCVEKQTNGLITKILSPTHVPSLTDVIFANALYFNGRWQDKFDASLTKEDYFHRHDGSMVRVSFMTNEEDLWMWRIYVFDGFKHLKLHYQSGTDRDDHRYFSMEIYLPDEKDGLAAMLESLDSDPGILSGDTSGDWSSIGKLKVPKFSFSTDFEVTEALKGLGLELTAHKVFHKSRVEVDEEGTTAVEATVVGGVGGCGPAKSKHDFVADHPFLFLVKENMSGLVVFLGQVLDPSITN